MHFSSNNRNINFRVSSGKFVDSNFGIESIYIDVNGTNTFGDEVIAAANIAVDDARRLRDHLNDILGG